MLDLFSAFQRYMHQNVGSQNLGKVKKFEDSITTRQKVIAYNVLPRVTLTPPSPGRVKQTQ